MKKIYYAVCIFVLTVFLIASPLLTSEAAKTTESETAVQIEIGSYELYVYTNDSKNVLAEIEYYLNNANVGFEKTTKSGNAAANLYTLKNVNLETALKVYAETSKLAKNLNANAIVNLSARGFTNDGYEYENIDVAKSIYKMLDFAPKNILKNEIFYEADGNGKIGDNNQEMQIVVRKSGSKDFNEFIVGIPSVLNEY